MITAIKLLHFGTLTTLSKAAPIIGTKKKSVVNSNWREFRSIRFNLKLWRTLERGRPPENWLRPFWARHGGVHSVCLFVYRYWSDTTGLCVILPKINYDKFSQQFFETVECANKIHWSFIRGWGNANNGSLEVSFGFCFPGGGASRWVLEERGRVKVG